MYLKVEYLRTVSRIPFIYVPRPRTVDLILLIYSHVNSYTLPRLKSADTGDRDAASAASVYL